MTRGPYSPATDTPGHHDVPVDVAADVNKRAQVGERAARLRTGQGEHPWSPQKRHGRALQHQPARGRDLDDLPHGIGEIQVDRILVLGEADEDRLLRPGEEGLTAPKLLT